MILLKNKLILLGLYTYMMFCYLRKGLRFNSLMNYVTIKTYEEQEYIPRLKSPKLMVLTHMRK